SDGWKLHTIRRQAFNLGYGLALSHDYKSLSAARDPRTDGGRAERALRAASELRRRQLPVGCRERAVADGYDRSSDRPEDADRARDADSDSALPVRRHGPRPHVCRLRNDGPVRTRIDPSQVDGNRFWS